MSDDATTEVVDRRAGFIRRHRGVRSAVVIVAMIALVAAYLLGIRSFGSSLVGELPEQDPPPGGVAVVLVPEQVEALEQDLVTEVLVFPSPELLDTEGTLLLDVDVVVQPAVLGQTVSFAAGQVPHPKRIVLPAQGTVQEYPFDTYQIEARVQAFAGVDEIQQSVPLSTSVFFRIPGWSWTLDSQVDAPRGGDDLALTLQRDFSTKSIALLLLLLMITLCLMAVLVARSITRGRLRREMVVASWLTALLFALIPLRAFFPGEPPLGSWIDVLVFFWVVAVIMVSVAVVVGSILLWGTAEKRPPG